MDYSILYDSHIYIYIKIDMYFLIWGGIWYIHHPFSEKHISFFTQHIVCWLRLEFSQVFVGNENGPLFALRDLDSDGSISGDNEVQRRTLR